MSEQARSVVDWLIKAAAALIPVFLAALVTVGWTNSHRIAVMARDIEELDKDVVHLRELVENRLLAPAKN